MLILDPSSHCDVCCESFSSLPQCIDCGHVFCSNCLDAICEKTWSPRHPPACPFCREPFTKDSVRKIRVDLKTPRPPLKEIDDDDEDDMKQGGDMSCPSEAKRLEEKVARAAASKCSFEEVSELHKEIQQWLADEVRRTSAGQHASLQLSAALLKAILLNCLAYSEASKAAKGVETSLKERLDNATLIKDQLEVELRKHRTMYSQKVRECQELRSEVNRLKLTIAPGNNAGRPLAIGLPPRSTSSPSPLSRSNTTASATTPTSHYLQRTSYFPRPSSTIPTSSIMNNNSRNLVVGSAPTSNTMASIMKLQTSPIKPRPASTRPVEDEKPPERWIPSSDDESVSSEKRFTPPSPERFSYGTSSAERPFTTSASYTKWSSRFDMPPVTV